MRQHRLMERPFKETGLPTWLSYVRAMLIAFVVLLAADWAAYLIWDRWLDWPFLVAIGIAWPLVMTAIT